MKQKDIKLLVISLFIIVIAYIGFNVYHNHATSTITKTVAEQIAPIPGSFDLETIEKVKKRNRVTPDFSAVTQPQTSPDTSPTPTSSPAAESLPIATESATEATEGGQPL